MSIKESNLAKTLLSLHFDETYLWDTSSDSEALKYPPRCHTLTLEDLLKKGYLQEKPDSEYFSLSDKAILALTLGRTLLHLFQGSWMQQPWSAKDVWFLYKPAANSVINIQRPYIRCSLSKDKLVEDLRFDEAHWQLAVLTFGQLLLEIETGEKIAIDQKKIAIDQNHLQQRLMDIIDDMGRTGRFARDSYFKAIDGCLTFNAQLKKEMGKDLADRVQKVLYDKIVSGLEANIDLFFNPVSLLRQPRDLYLGKGTAPIVGGREPCPLGNSRDQAIQVDSK